MKRVLVALLLGLVSLACADWGRWALGGPALLIDLPTPPEARTVPWDEPGAFGIVATNWSSTTPNVTVSVVIRYESLAEAKAWTARQLKGVAQGERAIKVSGNEAVQFNVGAASCLAIRQGGRTWVVAAEPKTGAGAADISRVMTSVEVERGGPMKWTRRAMGSGRMSAILPYELAPDANPKDPLNPRHQVDFQGFRVTADVARPDAGSSLDVKRTIDGIIADRKGGSGITEFKVERKGVRIDKAVGEIAEMTFKQGSRAKRVTALLVLENGVGYKAEVGGEASQSEWHNRIVGSLQVNDLNYAGFREQSLPSEGLKMDAPGEIRPEASNVGRGYGLFTGNIGITIRSVDSGEAGINLEQLGTFVDARLSGQKDAKGYKSAIVSTQIDEVDARIVRANFTLGREEMDQRAIVIAAADRTITIELLGKKTDAPLLDRMLDSIQFEPAPPSGWRRLPVGRSGLVAFLPKPFSKLQVAKEDWTKETDLGLIELDGAVICFFEAEVLPGKVAPEPAAMLRELVNGIITGMGGKWRLVEQKPAGNGLSGILHRLVVTSAGKDRPGDAYAFRSGDFLSVLLILHDPYKLSGRQAKQALSNSLQRG